MRLLVTGGAGFIGHHLVGRLLEEGHAVTVLDARSGSAVSRHAAAVYVQGDVRDRSLVAEVVSHQEGVFHLAAVVGVPNAMRHQWDSLTITAQGTVHVLEAARSANAPVFLASSSAIYGKSRTGPLGEERDVHLGNTHRPAWTYSYAKLTEELLGRAAAVEWGVRVVVGRLFNVIGPYQSAAYGAVVPRFVEQALAGAPLEVYGDGTQTRTFGDVRDVVRGILTVWGKGASGQVYNIGGVGETRILDLARTVVSLAGSPSEIRMVPFEQAFDKRFEETRRRVPSLKRLYALGYRPQHTLSDSLQHIIAHHRANRSRP